MSRRADETGKVRIVPFGPIDAETIAEFAWRTRRASQIEIEVVAPRRLGDQASLMERTAEGSAGEQGVVSLGLVSGKRPEIAADPARGVGLVTVPAQKAIDTLVRLVDEVVGALLPDAA